MFVREYFHHLENFSNTLEFLVTKNIMSSPKKSLITKDIISRKGSVAPRTTLCPDGHRASKGRQVHWSRQVPFLTPRYTLRPDDCCISWGRQVHKGRQVPSLTPSDTFRSDGCHISRGCQGLKGR